MLANGTGSSKVEADAMAAEVSLDWLRRHCFAAYAARSFKREQRRVE